MKKQLMSNKDKYYLILVFIVSLIPRLYVAADSLTVRHVSDNVALLASPAYFAGYNWSGVVSNAGYYGFGFYSMFFWVFHVTDDPVIIYRIFTLVGAVIQALTAPLCYYFLVNCLKYEEKQKAFLLSVISSFFVAVSASTVYNEIPFSFFIWIIAIVLCKMVDYEDKNKSRLKWSLILVVLLAYCLTIHTRTWSVIIAVALAVIFYVFLYRKQIFSVIILPAGCILYVLVQKIIQYMQYALWSSGNVDSLKNASINIGRPGLERLSSICKIMFGQANCFLVFSAGTIGLAILGIIFYCGERWYCRYRKKQSDDVAELILEKKSTLVGITMLIAFGGTILAQSISWSYAMNSGDEYAYKACFYLRYAIPFASVIAALGMRLCLTKRNNIILYILLLVSIFTSLYSLFSIFPFVSDQEVCGTAGMGAALGYVSFNKVSIVNYLKMLLTFWMLLCVLLLLLRYKKETLMLGLVCVVLVYQYFYNDKYVDKPVEEDNYTVVDASYQWVEGLKETGKKIPDTLYVCDQTDKKDHNNYYMYQFFFYDKTVIPEMPRNDEENVVLFSNGLINNMKGYEMLQLDKNEFVYLKGDSINLLYE